MNLRAKDQRWATVFASASVAACACFVVGCGQNSTSTPAGSSDGNSVLTQQFEPGDGVSTSDGTALAVFEKRILPIFQAKKPSSCTECHLSGVDLRDYIHPSQEKTFASLVRAELIDVETPDNSKILSFINRSLDEANLITAKVRQLEFEAFQAWIRAAVKDSDLLAAKDTEAIGPKVPDEVIRHARNDRVLASFIDNIWTEVGRCAAVIWSAIGEDS